MSGEEQLIRIEKKIDIKFDALNKTLMGFQKQISTHKVLIDTCEDDKDVLKESLYGNGKDGLVLKVDRIETSLRTTGIMKRSIWTNVISVFICVGVVATIIISLSSNKSDTGNKKILERIVTIEKSLGGERWKRNCFYGYR